MPDDKRPKMKIGFSTGRMRSRSSVSRPRTSGHRDAWDVQDPTMPDGSKPPPRVSTTRVNTSDAWDVQDPTMPDGSRPAPRARTRSSNSDAWDVKDPTPPTPSRLVDED